MKIDVVSLYKKYEAELFDLSFSLRPIAQKMQQDGFGVAFGDVEGELLYMLLRERKPSLVLEISPNAGWSTNYILAALTANAHGELHSFELLPSFHGRPTNDVIRGHLLPSIDQKRFTLHVGDATKTISTVPGTVDFLLLDSCHDAWFAEWYTTQLLPRCNGLIYIQDIAFTDRLENATEATYVWDWVEKVQPPLTILGNLEREINSTGARLKLAERMRIRSNSIVFEWPVTATEPRPVFPTSPEKHLAQAEAFLRAGDRPAALRSLVIAFNLLRDSIDSSNRNRVFLGIGRAYEKAGDSFEGEKCFKLALASSLHGVALQRAKGCSECLEWFLLKGKLALAGQTLGLILFEPSMWSRGFSVLLRFPLTAARGIARGLFRSQPRELPNS